MGKSALCIGGAGYVGSHVCKALAARGCKVTVLDDLSTGRREACKWGRLVIGGAEIIDQVLSEEAFDVVFHFGNSVSVAESVSNPEKYYWNNVVETLRYLRAIKHRKIPFIFSSSCSVYGNEAVAVDEWSEIMPMSPYARTKRMVEQILTDYESAYGMLTFSLRYFNAAGADPDGEIGDFNSNPSLLIPSAIQAALDGRLFTINGNEHDTKDGTCVRDFIHVSDLADAHCLAMDYMDKGGLAKCLNLGLGDGYSVLRILDAIESVTGLTLRRQVGPAREGDPDSVLSDNRSAKRHLGWEPKHSLQSIIETAYKWELKRRAM